MWRWAATEEEAGRRWECWWGEEEEDNDPFQWVFTGHGNGPALGYSGAASVTPWLVGLYFMSSGWICLDSHGKSHNPSWSWRIWFACLLDQNENFHTQGFQTLRGPSIIWSLRCCSEAVNAADILSHLRPHCELMRPTLSPALSRSASWICIKRFKLICPHLFYSVIRETFLILDQFGSAHLRQERNEVSLFSALNTKHQKSSKTFKIVAMVF